MPDPLRSSRWHILEPWSLTILAMALAAMFPSPLRADQAVTADPSVKPASAVPDHSTARELPPAWLSSPGSNARSSPSDQRWIAGASLAFVLAVCGGMAILARRYLPTSAMGQMKVVGRLGLTPKHAVYLVRVGRRVLVIGTGPQGSPSLISELDESECPLDGPDRSPADLGRRQDS